VSLANKAAAGFLWTTGANVGSRLLTIISTFILTRFLAPEVQGEFNLAYVFVNTMGYATALGVGQYVAAHPEEGRETVFHGTIMVLIAGLIVCTVCLLGDQTVARLVNVQGMAQYVPGLVLSHYIDRLGWLPRYILVRDLRFRIVGLRVALGEVSFAASGVALAYFGWGGFALVGANIVRSVVALAVLTYFTSWRDWLMPCRFALSTALKILRFGMPINVANLFNLGASSWDNAFMGWRFGEGTVGVYNQAYRIAELPATNVGEQINDVLVPTFARLDDAERRKRGFFRAASLMALLVFPMALGLGAIAPTMVEVLYPESYAGVAPFLIILATLSISRSIGVLAGGFLQVVKRTRVFMLIDGILVVLVLGLMWFFSRWGAAWSAVAVGIAFTISVWLLLRTLRPEGITVTAVVLAVLPPLLACIPMVAAVQGMRHLLLSLGVPGVVRLLAELATGGIVYVGAALLIAPTVSRDFIALGKGVIQRRRARKDGDSDAPKGEGGPPKDETGSQPPTSDSSKQS
jgi:PST family polysaccharide transporter